MTDKSREIDFQTPVWMAASACGLLVAGTVTHRAPHSAARCRAPHPHPVKTAVVAPDLSVLRPHARAAAPDAELRARAAQVTGSVTPAKSAAPAAASPSATAPRTVRPGSGTAAATGDRHRGAGDPVVATKQVQGVDFDLAGVTFDTTPPAGTHVEVRTHGESGWSGWTDLGLDGDGPDPGSADARHARPGTEAVAAAGSDGIDIRVTTPDGTLPRGLRASLVDGGRSSADDALSAPAGSAVAAVTRPTIISRAQWGADESLRTCDAERLPGFKAVVVHHTVNSNTYTADQAPAIIRSIYAYHTQSQGWCDIGYQILVDRFGRAYEGRKGSPAGFVQGAQAGGFNAETTGISVIGDFTSVPFSGRHPEHRDQARRLGGRPVPLRPDVVGDADLQRATRSSTRARR